MDNDDLFQYFLLEEDLSGDLPATMETKQAEDKKEGSIPPNFDKQWGMSDVVIRTEEKKNLHVNKTVMATFSPFFRALFFADFAEKLQDVVDVDVEHPVLLEILRVIHSVHRKYGQNNHSLYPADMLAKLYRAADLYDIECVRDLCKQQFLEIEARDAFVFAIELGLQKEKPEALKRMSFEDVQLFLKNKNDSLVLSPNDVALIVEKCQEHGKTTNRCNNCQSTNCRELPGYSNPKYYRCNNCGQCQKCQKVMPKSKQFFFVYDIYVS